MFEREREIQCLKGKGRYSVWKGKGDTVFEREREIQCLKGKGRYSV